MESAGEARRFQGRTVVIELDTEADLATADVVFDLNDVYAGDALVFADGLAFCDAKTIVG